MKARSMRTRVAMALPLVVIAALAQRRFPQRPDAESDSDFNFPKDAEFHFVRTEYTDLPQFRRGFGFVSRGGRANGWWAQDWPDADNHFTRGIQRLTRIDVGEPVHLGLTDDRIFDYPWIYVTQAANWDLSQAEVDRLRDYLMRGGFLVTDDFWGPDEWDYFRETMARVFPNKDIPDLAETDPVMHVLYDIREKDRTFIPGSRHLYRGAGGRVEVVQPAGTAPAWRAMYDDKNHMVVAVNFNTDVGDAWEFADVPYYPAEMTILAYRYGINYIVYSMTH
ncbi:MAG TPA: DUF4159 domain-containing protein [Bryobacteraceae bacterium]|jgi:hypothetical protein